MIIANITETNFWKHIYKQMGDFLHEPCPFCGARQHVIRKINNYETIEESVPTLRNAKPVIVFNNIENNWLFGYRCLCAECQETFMYLYDECCNSFNIYNYNEFPECDLFRWVVCEPRNTNGDKPYKIMFANSLFDFFLSMFKFKVGRLDEEDFYCDTRRFIKSLKQPQENKKYSEIANDLLSLGDEFFKEQEKKQEDHPDEYYIDDSFDLF